MIGITYFLDLVTRLENVMTKIKESNNGNEEYNDNDSVDEIIQKYEDDLIITFENDTSTVNDITFYITIVISLYAFIVILKILPHIIIYFN